MLCFKQTYIIEEKQTRIGVNSPSKSRRPFAKAAADIYNKTHCKYIIKPIQNYSWVRRNSFTSIFVKLDQRALAPVEFLEERN
jgi:hypothetical protein